MAKSPEVFGNLSQLARTDIERLSALYDYSVDRHDLISVELADELIKLSNQLGRKVAVILSRAGKIEHVVVGSKEILYLPDLGRYRLGRGRLRNLRVIITEPRDVELHLTPDLITDLEKLRLDLVALIQRGSKSEEIQLRYTHLAVTNAAMIVPYRSPRMPLLATAGTLPHIIELAESELAGLHKELSQSRTRDLAILVGVYPGTKQEAEQSMDELASLTDSAGVGVVNKFIQRRRPDPVTFVGKGKLEEIVLNALENSANILIFDKELRPGEWRAIINATDLKIIDRSMLILDIFARRASSSEGRLQVELAQLKYNLPRLVESDTGLSRLSGGIGGRGPGETKLEIGRRRIRERVKQLEERLAKLVKQRGLQSKLRRENQLPNVAIVGYTNAGKSTLFNKITSSSVIAESKMFATLDPAKRRLKLPYDNTQHPIIITDTVGFIRDLPTELRTAFRSTLDELYHADLLLHLVDVSNPQHLEQIKSVQDILSEMGIGDSAIQDNDRRPLKVLYVYNKIDKLPADFDFSGLEPGIRISAESGVGIRDLVAEIKNLVG